jgi:acetyltransferase-like isoleucine patch superfamily enzyme
MLKRAIRRFLGWAIKRLKPSGDESVAELIQQYRDKGATIGANVRLLGRLDGLNPHLVTIGNNCVIGARSALLTHCAIRGARPVVIEDEVWIGFNVLVLPGVRVGTQSVIGAGAVVTRDVPPRSVAAGNPARVLRSLTEEEVARLSHQLQNYMDIGKDTGPSVTTEAREPRPSVRHAGP